MSKTRFTIVVELQDSQEQCSVWRIRGLIPWTCPRPVLPPAYTVGLSMDRLDVTPEVLPLWSKGSRGPGVQV